MRSDGESIRSSVGDALASRGEFEAKPPAWRIGSRPNQGEDLAAAGSIGTEPYCWLTPRSASPTIRRPDPQTTPWKGRSVFLGGILAQQRLARSGN